MISAEELIQRIATEPSVLFWGQNYLGSMTGRNPFYDAVNKSMFNGMLSSEVDYTNLWLHLNEGKPVSTENIDALVDILINDVPIQPWLRRILSMRWGMVVTSAVDAAMFHCVGRDFSLRPISLDQRSFNRRDISKNTINISLLYGNITDQETLLKDCSSRSFRNSSKKINDRIGWIYENILSEYGVLVIDGWNPERDWLKNLLQNAGEMPYESIYLFGATPEILENEDVKYLQEEQILVAVEKTFAQFLNDIDYFELEESFEEENEYSEAGRVLTLSLEGQTVPIRISYNALSKLDSHIQVLYDDIWVGADTRGVPLAQLYAQFQRQVEPPVWYLHTSKYGFYFERSFDQKLKGLVEKEFRKIPYKRRHIIVEGNSNTGKTASLINLAYTERAVAPVIYIYGEPTQADWMEDLKDFIKSQFVDRQSAGKWISSVLIIWDANTDYNAPQRCGRLQSVLRETNAVVVGSAYPQSWSDEDEDTEYRDNSGNYHIVVRANLDSDEASRMLSSIKNVNASLYEKMSNKGTKAHLLASLQQMVRLEYLPEWKAVAEALQARFNQEVVVNEEFSDQKLEKYRDDMAILVDKEISKYGAASSWQLQLAQISKEYFSDAELIPEEKRESFEKFQSMERRIKLLNRILALCGEFSVEMPLNVVLRILSDDGKIFSNEKRFLFEIIGSDSLIRSNKTETGEISVCFRHPVEAEMYVFNNFGGDWSEIEENEVQLLKEIIHACRWGEDSEQIPVLQLVRAFGPNSWGTPRRAKTGRHFYEYQAWWNQIAEALITDAPDEPEVNLVYAFLIRNICRTSQDDHYIDTHNLMTRARDVLRGAIEKHNRINTFQYCRLLGEMCANLVFSMRIGSDDNVSNFYQLKEYFARAVSNWSDNSSQNLFTRNDLLDIWLNGVENYFSLLPSGFDPMGDPKYAEIIADSISYIEDLLDISEEDFDKSTLLGKIDNIYRYVNIDILNKYEHKLEESNNDSALFLRAWRCWRYDGVDKGLKNSSDRYIRYIANNLYMLPEDFDRRDEYKQELDQLLLYARHAAKDAISVLEEKRRLIDKSNSTRCLQMLIRAKWLAYTGYLPMTNKQTPALTDEQWSEIAGLCEEYIQYADRKNEQLDMSIVMLRMIYIWCFTRNKDEFDQLRDRQGLLRGNEWYFEKICICNPGTTEPKQFIINLVKNRNSSKNEYVATIAESVDAKKRGGKFDAIESIIVGSAKKPLHVSARVKEILLNGRKGQDVFKVDQPVVVWFNAKGPQVGLPGAKGGK